MSRVSPEEAEKQLRGEAVGRAAEEEGPSAADIFGTEEEAPRSRLTLPRPLPCREGPPKLSPRSAKTEPQAPSK